MELRDDRANYPVASRTDIALLRIIDCEFKKLAQSEGASLRRRGGASMYTVEYFETYYEPQVPIKLPP